MRSGKTWVLAANGCMWTLMGFESEVGQGYQVYCDLGDDSQPFAEGYFLGSVFFKSTDRYGDPLYGVLAYKQESGPEEVFPLHRALAVLFKCWESGTVVTKGADIVRDANLFRQVIHPAMLAA